MASVLDQIEHIFILMMENRSSHDVLGYLDAANPKIMGMANATAAGYANVFNAAPYAPAPRIDLPCGSIRCTSAKTSATRCDSIRATN